MNKGLAKGIAKISLIVLVLAAFGIFVLNFVLPSFADEARIWTDKEDYTPDETVLISGEGFTAASESNPVQIKITRPDGNVIECPDDYWCPDALPTTSSFSNYPYKLNGILGTYTVEASDEVNYASTSFTDKPIFSVTIIYPSYLVAAPLPVRVNGSWSVTDTPGQLSSYNVQIEWGDGNITHKVNINRTGSGQGGNSAGTFDTQPISGCDGVDDDCNLGTFDHYYNTTVSGCGPFNITVKLYHQNPPGAEAGDAVASTLIYVQEICNNGVDDDCDGLIDCADSDCLESIYCPCLVTVYTNR
ncbi:MAG: hypothetical protein QXL86_02660, partial [Candidatus Aenigmatarchaeota archaeon]